MACTGKLQQGFATGEMGSKLNFAMQKSLAVHVGCGSKATILVPWRDVRFPLDSDRNGDSPASRLVPKATNVHHKKTRDGLLSKLLSYQGCSKKGARHGYSED
jgi:hypothetical protein